MTAFAALPSLPTLDMAMQAAPQATGMAALPKPIRAAVVDSYVKEHRKSVPLAASNARATPRMSIEELNATDPDELYRRYSSTQIDTRDSLTRFLDLIDLPRNVIGNVIGRVVTPGKVAELDKTGDKGTFGLTSVRASDVLDGLGINNQVAKAVLGFVGDVALDPLTYIGPAGVGAKIAAQSSRSISLGKTGSKAVKAAAAAYDAGKSIDEVAKILPEAAAYFKASATPVGKAAESVFGGVKTQRKGVAKFLKGDDRFDSPFANDVWGVADDTVDEATKARLQAAKDLYKATGRPYTKGLRIYKDPVSGMPRITSDRTMAAGSGLLHVPFTDYSVTVPGFTREAREGAVAASLANDFQTSYKNPNIEKLQSIVDEIDDAVVNLEPQRVKDLMGTDTFNVDEYLEDYRSRLHGPRVGPNQRQVELGAMSRLQNAEVDVLNDPFSKPADIVHAHNVVKAYEAKLAQMTAKWTLEKEAADKIRSIRPQMLDELDDMIKQEAGAVRSEREIENLNRNQKLTALQEMARMRVESQDALNASNAALRDRIKDSLRQAEADFRTAKKAKQATGQFDRAAAEQQLFQQYGITSLDDLKPVSKKESDYFADIVKESGVSESEILPLSTKYDDIVPEATIRAREKYKQDLNPELLSILNTTDDEIKALVDYVDALHVQATAAHRISQVAKAPLLNQMGGRVKTLADAAEIVNGLSDTNLGSSMISSMNSVIQSIAGDRANTVLGDSTLRSMRALEILAVKHLGMEQGVARDLARDVVKAQQLSGSPSSIAVADDINRKLKAAIKPENLPEAQELLYHVMEYGDEPLKGSWPDDEGVRIVQAAMQGGLLDKKLNPEAAKAITELAAEYKALMAELYYGREGLENYAGRMLTPEAQARAKSATENIRPVSSSSAPQTIPTPLSKQWQADFEKQRKTIEYRWNDPVSGKEYRFIDSDRAFDDYRKEVEYLRPEERDYVKAKLEGIDAFDALGPKAQSLIERHPLSAAEINKRVNEGMFPLLTRGPLNGRKFFETNAAAVLANRVGQAERKQLSDQLRSLAQAHALDGEIDLIPGMTKPLQGGKVKTFRTKSGVQGRVFERGGKDIVQIGNAEYRQIFPTIAPDQNPAYALFTGPGKSSFTGDRVTGGDQRQLFQQWYPTWAADLIEDSSNLFSKQDPNQLLQALEESTKLWKIATLSHPSWIVNDLAGNFILAAQHFSPRELMRHAKFAIELVKAANRGDEAMLRKLTTKVRGSQDISAYDVVFGPGRQVLGNHTAQEAMLHATRAGEYLRPQDSSLVQAGRKAVTGDFAGAKAELRGVADETVANAKARARASNIEAGVGSSDQAVGAKAIYSGLVDETIKRRLWAPWAKMNGMVNDWVRISAYMAALDRGMDAESAARFINTNMLDMGMQTATDESIRRFFPFYSWIKNSGLYGIRQLAENPKFFSIIPHFKPALEEAINGEATLPEHQRPSWLRNQMAIQLGSNPETRRALTLTSSVPIEASAIAATAALTPFFGSQSLQDTASFAVNSLNPIVKAGFEIGTGRQFFTKRSIGANEGDITVPEYLADQIRPLRELGVGQMREGPLVRAFEDSPIQGAGRLVLGGRIQPFDDDRRLYQLQKQGDDMATAIRKRIGLAEREGNKEESLRQRARLLRLYTQMQENGLKVPGWFRVPEATGQQRKMPSMAATS